MSLWPKLFWQDIFTCSHSRKSEPTKVNKYLTIFLKNFTDIFLLPLSFFATCSKPPAYLILFCAFSLLQLFTPYSTRVCSGIKCRNPNKIFTFVNKYLLKIRFLKIFSREDVCNFLQHSIIFFVKDCIVEKVKDYTWMLRKINSMDYNRDPWMVGNSYICNTCVKKIQLKRVYIGQWAYRLADNISQTNIYLWKPSTSTVFVHVTINSRIPGEHISSPKP